MYAVGALLAPSAYAESSSYQVGLKLNVMDADGTVTTNYGTYNVDETDIVNYGGNFNIVLSNTSVSYNVSYLTFSLAGLPLGSGSVGRYDVTMYLDFVGDFVSTDPVIGGEFIVGLWIQNYRESYDYDLDQVYFTGEGSGGTGFNTEYLGFSSIGCKLFKCTIRPDSSGNNSPLSKFRKIAVKWHWTGNPASGEINFVFGNSSYLVCMTSEDADIDYMQDQNEVARSDMEQAIQDLHVDSVDPTDVGSSVVDDLSVIDDSGVLDTITVKQSSSFVQSLIGWGATSLSVCLIGYILFGKKG